MKFEWEDIVSYIYYQYEDAKILFDLDNCYFEESVMIDQLDNYSESEKAQAITDYENVGCIIKNNDVIFPKGVSFTFKPAPKNDSCAYYICRKGEELCIDYPDEIIVHIELTDIGNKCLMLTKTPEINMASNLFGISKAYNYVKTIEKIFNIHIVN